MNGGDDFRSTGKGGGKGVWHPGLLEYVKIEVRFSQFSDTGFYPFLKPQETSSIIIFDKIMTFDSNNCIY